VRKVMIGLAIILALALLGGGGYFFIYPMVIEQNEANDTTFENAGKAMGAGDFYEETEGVLGAKQQPATFADDKLSPSQRVIRGLMDDREELIQGNKKLERRIDELIAEVKTLEDYKETNERFAPLNAAEEKSVVESMVKRFLIDSEDAVRFSNMQIEIMAAAAAKEYSLFIGRNRLMLTDEERAKMVEEHLTPYAFCVGDGVDVAANNNRELRAVSYYMRSEDASRITPILLKDLKAVLKPCNTDLFAGLSLTLND